MVIPTEAQGECPGMTQRAELWRAPAATTTFAGVTTHLVTGAQGYVGRYLSRELLDRYPDDTVVGVGRSAPEGDALERYVYESADILDVARMSAVLHRFRPESIFHLAAAPHNATPAEITQANVLGTVSLLDAIVAIDGYRPRVVIGSSGAVYGALDDDQLPASESAPCLPVDIQGATKLAAEHLARIIGERHGVCVMLARIFNVYGPGQSEAAYRGPVQRPGDGEIRIGTLGATRDFIDVRDVATALTIIGERGACGEAYNVSSGPGVPRHYGDATRLRELGFVQRYRVEDNARGAIADQRR